MYLKRVMKYALLSINEFDNWFIGFLNKYSLTILRISLAVIFIWFGGLKLFGQSPAIELITKTVYWFDPKIFVPILGIWEVVIGICMLFNSLHRPGLFLLALQMPGTFLPLVLLPEVCFVNSSFWSHLRRAIHNQKFSSNRCWASSWKQIESIQKVVQVE